MLKVAALRLSMKPWGQYSFGLGKTTQRKSKPHTPRCTHSVSSMHWYRMRERWASLVASAEFHEGSRPRPDGRIRKLIRIGLPIIQAGSNDRADYRQSRSGGVPQGVKLPRPFNFISVPLRERGPRESGNRNKHRTCRRA